MNKLNDAVILSYNLATDNDMDNVYDLYMNEDSNPFLTYDIMERSAFEKIYDELLSSGTLYVVNLNDEVAGSYRIIQKTHRQCDTVYLGGFVVKNLFKGKGIGRTILLHIKDEAMQKGLKRIELTVDLQNETAINLYKKIGFEIEGIVRKSYKIIPSNNYFDEYLMSLIL